MKRLSRRKFIGLCSGAAAALSPLATALAYSRPTLREGERLWFEELTVRDHRIFRGLNTFRFHPERNVVIGSNGSGKTTLARLLTFSRPGGNEIPNVRLRVGPEGCEGLLRRHRDLIHVDDHALTTGVLARLSEDGAAARLEPGAAAHFRRLVPHADHLLRRHGLVDILRGGPTGYGERAAAGFAFLLAERDAAPYRLPLVLDNPFGSMDLRLTQSLSAAVAALDTQVILLTTEHQLTNAGWPEQTVPVITLPG